MPKSVVGPILGAGIGAVSGKKGQTQTNKPYLPEDREKAYTKQLEDALKIYDKPFEAAPMTRETPSNMFGGLFNNPELQMIQQQSDKKYFDSLLNPATDTTPVDNGTASAEAMANLQKYNDVRYDPASTFKNKQGGYDDRTILRTALGDDQYQKYSDKFNESASAGTAPQSVYDFIMGGGKKPQAAAPSGYEAFSQKRAAQGLPPMTPADYERMMAMAGGM